MTNETDLSIYASRMRSVPASCVREIMKAAGSGNIISFAGGLPNPELFPVEEISAATEKVLRESGAQALQYSASEGYLPLREYVAKNILRPCGIAATADNIIITTGSQQALDLIGKVLIDPGDRVVMESPSYLSAIQAFSLYQPEFVSVPLEEDGMDTGRLEEVLKQRKTKLVYCVPTFQNPTGISYSQDKRRKVAELAYKHGAVLVEDNPYGELNYDGDGYMPVISYCEGEKMLTGTFSKVLSPGMRMGWLFAEERAIEKLVIARQASDLCGSEFTQRILYQYLADNDLEAHVTKLRDCYRLRRDAMLEAVADNLPGDSAFTRPSGGMFLWAKLSPKVSTTRLLEKSIKRGVAFAPGKSFYANMATDNEMRLNFTHATPEQMKKGMRIIREEIDLMSENK